MSEIEESPLKAVRRLEMAGYGLLVLLFGGAGVWASTAEIAGAVIAPGTIVVQSNVKKVQHLSGGVVSQIAVHDGDQVEAGQLLIRLDDTVARATVGVVRVQLDELQARQARLEAERDDAEEVVFPSDLMSRSDERQLSATLVGERKLFDSRRAARSGQRSQLQERIEQSKEEIRGLEAQLAAKEQEVAFIEKELSGVTDLWSKGLVPITRLMQLSRDKARLDGERGQYIAEIARAKGKISETGLQVIQIEKDFRSDVMKDLRETQGKVGELTERLVAAQDQLQRTNILAPQSGIVNQLSVHTVGGVVGTGEVLMEIVPRDDQLVIESKVDPRDIDQVKLGAPALVRVLAGESRANLDLTGKVVLVSADLAKERAPTGAAEHPYYAVRISLPKTEAEHLGGLKLLPGMQAEAFIQTYPRTPIAYLVKPLQDQMTRAFRER